MIFIVCIEVSKKRKTKRASLLPNAAYGLLDKTEYWQKKIKKKENRINKKEKSVYEVYASSKIGF